MIVTNYPRNLFETSSLHQTSSSCPRRIVMGRNLVLSAEPLFPLLLERLDQRSTPLRSLSLTMYRLLRLVFYPCRHIKFKHILVASLIYYPAYNFAKLKPLGGLVEKCWAGTLKECRR